MLGFPSGDSRVYTAVYGLIIISKYRLHTHRDYGKYVHFPYKSPFAMKVYWPDTIVTVPEAYQYQYRQTDTLEQATEGKINEIPTL